MPHGGSNEHSHDGTAKHRHLRKHAITDAADHSFGPSNTQFLREDGAWATPSGGGGDVFTAMTDTTCPDWTKDSGLTIDQDWHDLGLAAKGVPADAKAVILQIYMMNNTVGQALLFRPNGWTSNRTINTRSRVANVAEDQEAIVPCVGGEIEYNAYNGGTWAALSVWLIGWWEPA